ncbi:VOC family protein [Clostridium sp. ZS2]|uniref:VOC family protein n=1 Tax=Clostridium sp. ZS2 TaxID=2949988 RepID=UPI0013F9E3ED|nr:VOC family protein [Clostridium sp. ZS2]MBN1068209.1 glyoxalase [Clostridium botulinum]NFR87806.1 glyoxalase [Clostridium botulinum]NFR91146.1 glyoxalase [Clostridium botulinum]NFU00363.1 glyoxalase [Clostridium botulinum]
MKFTNPLIVVNDIEKAKQFYHEVLGLNVILDFGSNITLTGGISLQTKKSWMIFINKQEDEIQFGGNNAELYFEEENFDSFIEKINNIADIEYVHPVIEHSWGQRVVRFYDLDKHIIEIGESMSVVCKRFMKSGLSIEETAKRMDVPAEYVQSCIK